MLRRLLDAVRRHYGFLSVANSLLDGEGYSSAVSFARPSGPIVGCTRP